MIKMYHFFVPGIVKPKGSMKSFVNPKTNRVVSMNNDPKTKPWQAVVQYTASQHIKGILRGPVGMTLKFVLPRPNKPKFMLPGVRPDIDKLSRTILDALTGVAYIDDCQVADLHTRKIYGDIPGVHIWIEDLNQRKEIANQWQIKFS